MHYHLDSIVFNIDTDLTDHPTEALLKYNYRIQVTLDTIMLTALELLTPIRCRNGCHYIFHLGDTKIITKRMYVDFWNNVVSKLGFKDLINRPYNMPSQL